MEQAFGKDHQNVATVLEDTADLYEKIGKISEAKSLEERAKEIRSKAK
jgi:hypothetical protein